MSICLSVCLSVCLSLLFRDRVHNSNSILLTIPVEIKVLEHREKFTVTNYDRVHAELSVSDTDVAGLRRSGIIHPFHPARISKATHRL
jgi:hypothetical protein